MKKENYENQPAKATHEEICDHALKHYKKISMEHPICEWCSTVPRAIKFYKKYGEKMPPLCPKCNSDDIELVKTRKTNLYYCNKCNKFFRRRTK